MVCAMSDPVSNAEIEDVLSSIRRLVSEGGRPVEAGLVKSHVHKVETPVADTPEPADRLVLTPALRIADEEELPSEDTSEEVEIISEISADALADDADGADEDVSDEAQEDASELVFTHVDYDAEDDSETWVEDAEDTIEEVYDEDQPGDEVYDIEAESEDALEAEDGFALPDPDSRILRWESVSNPKIEPYEPDEPGDSDYAGTNIEPLQWHGRDYQDTTSADLADTMAESIEAEAVAYAEEEIEHSIAPELSETDGDESITLDEAMLREMVADIVRQELQGTLGERITRNVRKLVRREIHRALAAHDLG